VTLGTTVECLEPETRSAPVKLLCTLYSTAVLFWQQSATAHFEYPLWSSTSQRLGGYLESGDGRTDSKNHLCDLELVILVELPPVIHLSLETGDYDNTKFHCGACRASDSVSSCEVVLPLVKLPPVTHFSLETGDYDNSKFHCGACRASDSVSSCEVVLDLMICSTRTTSGHTPLS